MSAFSVTASSVAPSVEIVNRFQEVTVKSYYSVETATLKSETEETIEESIDHLLEVIGKNLNSGVRNSHEIFNFIDETTRPRVWKKFLNLQEDCTEQLYISTCQEETKLFDSKIREDGFRTYKGNQDFWSKVSEDVIVRALNALATDFGYVQGMNVLLAPFLYIMSESDSFFCMRSLIHDRIPRYVLKNLDGVHDGAKLFSRCLRICDSKLYTHIISKIPDLSIFSLRYILTLFANSKPLAEVLKLWDAILAVGVHFNIALLCAKLMLQRDALLKEKRGAKILLLLEEAPVDSKKMIDGAFCLLQFIPTPLFHELLSHATSKTVTTTTTPTDSPPPSAHSSGHTLSPTNIASATAATGNVADAGASGSGEKVLHQPSFPPSFTSNRSTGTSKANSRSTSPHAITVTARSGARDNIEHVHVVSTGNAVHT